jgi:tetratricopeptide (TPR) repeat protein
MMTSKSVFMPCRISNAAALLILLPVTAAFGQAPQIKPALPSSTPAATPAASPSTGDAQAPNRAVAYYHLALANIYEDEALENGNVDASRLAVDEYKNALNADPTSPQLNDGLADLYFRTGHIHEAEVTARNLLKNTPDNIDAHKLLGRIYLRQLSDASNAVSSTSPSGNVLDQAIAEFEKIVGLQPKDVEDRMVLGQLYTVKHDTKKAEEQFKTAQSIEPDSEEAVLNLARLYAESGDLAHAVKVIESVPVNDRSPKVEVALGAAYDQLKQTKNAIAAYQRAADMDPGDAHTLDVLGQALLADNQLDEALKQFKLLAESDPENTEALIHIGEIQRRQGKYEDALATIRKARKQDLRPSKPATTKAASRRARPLRRGRPNIRKRWSTSTSHANGAYTGEEKTNRSFFLERLGQIYHEENKTDQAIATYQKMVDMGGDAALRGLESQVEVYGEAKMFDRASEIARKASDSHPKDLDLKLMLAGTLVEQGKSEDALTMTKGASRHALG